ncbi:hypothetical protein AcdelDRAFT_0862 [Acidovorax delafieldii 2AN]|uniref:Uncharacterized protein n=1 Tax=Acidovorax delafieldii 2AN TaxID=573060 RepID=C5T1T2_ACIDE|nr:hypothetical protein [Acidovorax delafieldii]EER61527.1 hypothetical protein AcdelDRAFT_0862 [Acidovorax delafieldii 2AN]
MKHSLPLNAFQSVRPRGPDLDITAAAPRKTNHSRAPIEGNVQQALDRNGRRTVSLAPRAMGSIQIESREQSQASADRRARISKGGTK